MTARNFVAEMRLLRHMIGYLALKVVVDATNWGVKLHLFDRIAPKLSDKDETIRGELEAGQ